MEQEKIGKFIAALRKEKNMTQVELAEKIGVTDRAVSKWENGRGMPDISVIKPLCDELGITVNEFLSGERIEKSEHSDEVEKTLLNTLEYTNKKIKTTKNKFKIILLLILITIFLFALMFAIDVNRMKDGKSVIFSTWGYEYVPPINLREDEIYAAIENYILGEREKEIKHYENEKWFLSYNVYLLEEKERDALYYVYAWVLEESYYNDNGKIELGSGSSVPHKFTVQNINGEFKVTDAKYPRDGSYYIEDIEKLFPKYVREDMDKVHLDGTIDRLSRDIQKQVKLYFHK